MSAATDPAEDAARLAPPPPGTVVWSLLTWSELLADFAWLESRWAPLAAGTAGSHGAVLLGNRSESPEPRGTECAATAGGSRLQADAGLHLEVPLATLHPFVIL